jgi:hypothetical protein
LQVGYVQPALRHAATSIAAIHESYNISSYPGDTVGRDVALKSFALQQSNKAISTLMVSDVPLPVILMSSVVFACQQMLLDDQAANRIIKSGITMLEDVEYDRGRTPPEYFLSSNDHHFINNHVKPMLDRFRAYFCSSIDPPYALRLVLDSRSPRPSCRLPRIPSEFTSLREARDCWTNYSNGYATKSTCRLRDL